MKLLKVFKNGIIDENPTFRLVLGTCPTLAITTSAINGIGMGLSTTAVLMGSNIVISLLRKFIPAKVRMPAFVTVIAGFVTIVQMLLKAYVPVLDKALGIYIPLIVVNCIIMARAESFASKNPVMESAVDGLGMGIGFTIAITVIGGVREIFGNGSIFGMPLFGADASPALAIILPPGGFLVFGLSIGLVNLVTSRKKYKQGLRAKAEDSESGGAQTAGIDGLQSAERTSGVQAAGGGSAMQASDAGRAANAAGCHGCAAGCAFAAPKKEVGS